MSDLSFDSWSIFYFDFLFVFFFFSSRRRHTRCALVTGVQTCALPIYPISMGRYGPTVAVPRIVETYRRLGLRQSFFIPGWCLETYPQAVETIQIGRASCRERVCQYV